ncbi:MAG: copper amine oxidase N-terminal domain-containing protein, partial [Candidatus Calescibacterium sp.]|nr:copper amine oxidase N-terminal domain-containing protein [Candidatus Calescibacterium sp.]
MYRILFFLVFFIVGLVFSQSLQKADLLYNDNKFSAYIINNTSYLSKEDLAYIIGSPIKWDNEEKIVIIDNMRIYTKVLIYKSQMLLGIKEILQPLGYQIKWNQNTRTITIIPPINKNKDHKANIKIEKNTNNTNNTDDKPKEQQKYEIPFINNGKNKEQSGVKPDQSLQIVFIPRSAFNEEYKVTVSDMKETKIYKGTYNAQSGYKFVIINVSQQNMSNKVQLYTGKFTLFDNRNTKYEYIEGLSSYV